MKKYLFFIVLVSLLFLGINLNTVLAYSPDCLPGGINYISSENFIPEDVSYITQNPFLVKPYTEYTFGFPRDYEDTERPTITLSFYENNNFIDYLTFTDQQFSYDNDMDIYYFSFMTDSETNYLGIELSNVSGYLDTYGLNYFQLEEGTSPTAYQSYEEGDIIDTEAPYFQNAGNIISYYDSPITADEIKSSLTAYDAIDGDVSGNIIILSDNYTPNINALGTYQIVFEVSDSSNNKSQVTVNVQLVDVLKPVFSDVGTIQAVYPNTYSADDIKSMLSASDNYDGDISNLITLESDDYSVNASITGTYEMNFSVTDSSGNTAYYTQEIQVVDNQGPIITGITDIVIGYDTLISQDDLISNLNVTDNYDSSDSLNFVLEEDTYTSNHDMIGTYNMKFSVTDSNGNKTYQDVNISVVDQIGPLIYFDSSVIQVYNDNVMSLPDFIDLLSKANEIDSSENYYVTVKYDSYSSHADIPGKYHILLDLENDKGEIISKKLEVNVIDKHIDYIYPGKEMDNIIEKSWFEKYKTYVIGGSLSLVAVISNAAWFILFKKK